MDSFYFFFLSHVHYAERRDAFRNEGSALRCKLEPRPTAKFELLMATNLSVCLPVCLCLWLSLFLFV